MELTERIAEAKKMVELKIEDSKRTNQPVVEKKKLEPTEKKIDRLHRTPTFWICLTILFSVILICITILQVNRYEYDGGSDVVDKYNATRRSIP